MIDKIFQHKLEEYKKQINNIIIDELESRKPNSLYKPLVYFIKSGGKRLRAILLILCADAIKNKGNDKPINQAIAIELLHNFTLIHDDIMDNSEKRHNKKTLHKKFDLGTAILAGDALLAMAYEFLEKDLSKNNHKIFSEFTKALTVVCEGQALDKEFEIRKRITLPQYFEMITKKTGALIKATCKIGALTKTEDDFIIEQLGQFGEMIGVAFQIQDDLLDIVGNEKKFGKSRGSDLVEGKKTYLLLKALQKAGGKDLDKLKQLIENKGIKQSNINQYINIFEKLGVIEDTKLEIEKYHSKAADILDNLQNYLETEDLRQFLSLVINRQN